MSRPDFETEYRELIRAEAPQLWERIEAEIDRRAAAEPAAELGSVQSAAEVQAQVAEPESAQSAAGSAKPRQSSMEVQAQVAEPESVQSAAESAESGRSSVEVQSVTVKRTAARKRLRWLPYVGVAAAAAVCLSVAIPVMTLSRRATESATESASAVVTAGTGQAFATEQSEEGAAALDEAYPMEEARENSTDAAVSAGAAVQGAAQESVTEEAYPTDTAEEIAETESDAQTNGITSQSAEWESVPAEWSNVDAKQRETEGREEDADAGNGDAETPIAGDGTLLYGGREVSASTIIVAVVEGTPESAIAKLQSKYRLSLLYDYDSLHLYAFTLDTPAADADALRGLLEAVEREDFVLSAEPDQLLRID